MNKYIDVTNDYFKFATPYSHDIKFDDKFVDEKKVVHPIKGKEIAHKPQRNSDEYLIALLLEKELGGDIHMVPRITDISNSCLKTPTPDYLWNNEKWDLKIPGVSGKFENTLERFLKKKNTKLQATKIIIDYKYYNNVSKDKILKVIQQTLKNPHRLWLEELIVIKNSIIISILKKSPLSS